VLNPLTNSDSPSVKSNGARLVSAKIVMRRRGHKIKQAQKLRRRRGHKIMKKEKC
jgi:hypothetical protein